MRFSLDTNAVIALMKGHSRVLERMKQHGTDTITLCVIAMHELHFGATKSDHVALNLSRLEALPFRVLDYNHGDAVAGAQIRLQLRKQGMPIGPLDALIAGQALARDLTLVTRNTREFQRVSGLRVADWEAG